MPLIPFSERHPDEFLSRTEDNFDTFLETLKTFYNETREDIQDGKISRRNLDGRFNYKKELTNLKINQKGLDTQEISAEFNDMLKGCIRHQDPMAAFNIISSPLLASVAGMTLASLYNPNPCWDFISGKLCLYEKKIARMLGNLVGWPHADGFVVTGGKQSLAYAIKNGIGRASAKTPGKMDDYVVVCSALAHYSIEHVCDFLGISPGNCLRVATRPSGEIDLQALKTRLERAVLQGKKIAAVIAVAGATINLVPDPILSIKETIDLVVKEHRLDYTPYLHVDSVITWAWLAFDEGSRNPSNFRASPKIMKKVQAVLSKLSGIKHADSFAADFHKTGFCPYAAGVLITKDFSALSGLIPDEYIPPEDPYFGELEPFRQTFENSRSGLSIISIWIALRKMGLEGLRQFVLYQLEVCELFKKKIRESYSDHFQVLNHRSNGWEIVLKPHFRSKISWDHLQKSSEEEQREYINNCHAFLNDCWYSPLEKGELQYPLIGFIRKYSRKGTYEESFPAFLIHPTSLHYDERAIDEMLEKLFSMKKTFDLRHSKSTASSVEEHLYAVTPPR